MTEDLAIQDSNELWFSNLLSSLKGGYREQPGEEIKQLASVREVLNNSSLLRQIFSFVLSPRRLVQVSRSVCQNA